MDEAKGLIMGFFYGILAIELLVCIIKMFIDTKNMKNESNLLDEMMKSDLDVHHATMTIMNDMADRLNVIEDKLGISHEENEEHEVKDEEHKEELN